MPHPSKRRKCIVADSTNSEDSSEHDLGLIRSQQVIANAVRKQQRDQKSVEFRRKFHTTSQHLTSIIEETTQLQGHSFRELVNQLMSSSMISNSFSGKTQIKLQTRKLQQDRIDIAESAKRAIKSARDVQYTSEAFPKLLEQLRCSKPYILWNLDLKLMQEVLDTGRTHCLQRATLPCEASFAVKTAGDCKEDYTSFQLLPTSKVVHRDDQWCEVATKLVRSMSKLGASVL